MTHVSKKLVAGKNFLGAYNQLTYVFTKLKAKSNARDFATEFLTRTERIMLTKRLAIILMTARGYSSVKIGRHLKVSTSTVLQHRRKFLRGDYVKLLSLLGFKTKKNYERLWKEIERLFKIPPIAGPGRWTWVNEISDYN